MGSTSPVYVAAAATWASWAVGAVTAKFYKVHYIPLLIIVLDSGLVRDP